MEVSPFQIEEICKPLIQAAKHSDAHMQILQIVISIQSSIELCMRFFNEAAVTSRSFHNSFVLYILSMLLLAFLIAS